VQQAPPDVNPDCELVARIKRGDRNAFQTLYDKYLRLVYRYVRVRIGDEHDTEDLVADTFLKAWRGLATFECGEKPVGAWLLRIAHNLVVDTYRQKRLELGELPGHIGAAEHQFAGVEHRDEIRRAFGTLNYEQQIIVHMHFFEDYSLDEVAEFLGKSGNAVRVAQFRALRRLRQALQHEPA
jgi:RNA polymerase sigma-70 factor (ECF subfamily)